MPSVIFSTMTDHIKASRAVQIQGGDAWCSGVNGAKSLKKVKDKIEARQCRVEGITTSTLIPHLDRAYTQSCTDLIKGMFFPLKPVHISVWTLLNWFKNSL